MNIFKRIGDIVSSNVNSALDKMEDPEKMIDLSIRQLEDSNDEMRVLLSEKKSEQAKIENSIKESENLATRWNERARLAVEKDLDDMAREAIGEKRKIEDTLEVERSAKSELDYLVGKLEENLTDAKGKLADLKSTSVALKARAQVAKERLKVNKKANVDETASYSRRLEELKLKIERWESEADIHHEDLKKKAERQTPSFEELEKDSAIEKELEELKRQKKELKVE